ncbi:MAG: phospholipase [Deltaproteobacteria bacterium]|nr:phospholipase [Deltaproteobacteria bacterium]
MRLLLLTLLLSFSLNAHFRTFFESSEHTMSGDNVMLILGKAQNAGKALPLHMPNGLVLTFGDLVAMPDFYGVVGKPISQGKSFKDRQIRFFNAFKSLAFKKKSKAEAEKIMAVIHNQRDRVLDALKKGKSLKEIKVEIGEAQNVKWNCLTGGACSGTFWWLSPGRYLNLAKEDYDHFGQDAFLAYQAGHHVSMHVAAEAGKKGDYKMLELAYALDGFACHFLTDRFSAGHIRTPRATLANKVTPSVFGSLLAGYMHTEENTYGVHVHNERGDSWMAYGDRFYLDKRNQKNRDMMAKALQNSADEIYETFEAREMIASTKNIAVLFPEADEMAPHISKDISPMFWWSKKYQTLMRRKDLNDVWKGHWTNDWWGWSTLAMLRNIKGDL